MHYYIEPLIGKLAARTGVANALALQSAQTEVSNIQIIYPTAQVA